MRSLIEGIFLHTGIFTGELLSFWLTPSVSSVMIGRVKSSSSSLGTSSLRKTLMYAAASIDTIVAAWKKYASMYIFKN